MSNNTTNTPGRLASTSPTWTRADGKSKVIYPEPYSNRVRRAPEGQYGPTRLEPGEPVWPTRVIMPLTNGRPPIALDAPDPQWMARAQRDAQRAANRANQPKSPFVDYDFTPTQQHFPNFIPRAGPIPFSALQDGYTPAHAGPSVAQPQTSAGVQEQGPIWQNPWNCPPAEPTPLPQQDASQLPPAQQYHPVVPTPQDAAQMPGFNMGREIGRLEAEASNNHKKYLDSEERGNFYREDAHRLRRERDSLREELVKAQTELEELQLRCFNEHERPVSRRSIVRERDMASLSSVNDSPNGPFEPSSALVVAGGGINRASNNNSAHSAAHSLASSTHSLYKAPTSDPVPAGRTSYTVPADFPISELVVHLTKLFKGTENWGGQFATLPMSTLATNTEVQNILNTLVRICQDRVVDDLIERLNNRGQACAAIIADAIIEVMGPNVMNGFSTELSAELESIKADLIRTRMGPAAEHYAVLERRAALFMRMQKSPDFMKFREEKIGKTCVKLCKLLSPMVPHDKQHQAILDLRRLIREAYAIGLRMATFPCEWLVQQAERNERWIPESMQQRDPALVNNPKLTNSNGYAYVVRFGIHPSVVEKDFSSGGMIPRTHTRKVVSLMENPAAKLTSDLGRR